MILYFFAVQTTYIKKSSRISQFYFEGCMYIIRDDLYTTNYRIIWSFQSRVNSIQLTKQLENCWIFSIVSNVPNALYNYKRTDHCEKSFTVGE